MLKTFSNLMHKFVKQVLHNCFVFLAVLLKLVMAFIYSHPCPVVNFHISGTK